MLLSLTLFRIFVLSSLIFKPCTSAAECFDNKAFPLKIGSTDPTKGFIGKGLRFDSQGNMAIIGLLKGSSTTINDELLGYFDHRFNKISFMYQFYDIGDGPMREFRYLTFSSDDRYVFIFDGDDVVVFFDVID